jgi:uncharacterized protein (TIGR02391 family)
MAMYFQLEERKMILTDSEMRQFRRVIEEQAGLDAELLQRCGHLIRVEAFDEAVRSAFVLLEERLRRAVRAEGLTGTQLANHAFNATKGVLAKHLGHSESEREGLRELYSGAFRLFRNPTAHGIVGYSPAEGKAIIGLVDLMLKIVKRAEELPPPDIFPDNLEAALIKIEEAIGPGAASRLRVFLSQTYKDVGLRPSTSATQWIPFRRHCLYKATHWDEAKPHRIAVFYLLATGADYGLSFLTSYYYRHVVGFNVERLIEELTELGFWLRGKNQEPYTDFKIQNAQSFFDALLELVVRTVDELDGTLHGQTG